MRLSLHFKNKKGLLQYNKPRKSLWLKELTSSLSVLHKELISALHKELISALHKELISSLCALYKDINFIFS